MKTTDNKIKVVIICIVFCLYNSAIYCQLPLTEQQKYWTYRQRFLTSFIDTSSDPNAHGTNIPAGIRHIYTSSIDSLNTKLDWGDATIYLSQYINVLATEYRLLKNNGQDYSQTVRLLINALNTYLRLDKYAETYFRYNFRHLIWPANLNQLNPSDDDINGFFIRDDVSENILDAHDEHLRFDNHLGAKIEEVTSAGVNLMHGNPPNCEGASQDQMWHLLLSMAMVKKLVDNNETGNFTKYGTKSITWMASEIARLMVSWAQHNHSAYEGDNYLLHPWVLVNPETFNAVGCDGDNIIGNGPGSWCFGEAGSLISGVDMHYLGSRSAKEIFQLGVNYTLAHDKHFIMDNYCLFSFSTIIGNICDAPFNLGDSYDETYKMLLGVVNTTDGHFEHLPLMFKLLHNVPEHSNIYDLKTQCRSVLSQAPSCGNYCYGVPFNTWVEDPLLGPPILHKTYVYEYGSAEWSSPDRLYKPESLTTEFGPGDFRGDYNGVDYMLLYNLYQLVYGTSDVSENVILAAPQGNIPYFVPNLPFPMVMVIGDSPTNQFTAQAQNEIIASNTITYSVNPSTNATFVGYANYVAGKSIHLTTGFHAMAGSHFRAYIDNSLYYHKFETADLYSCGGIPSVGVMAYQAPDSAQNQHYIFPVEMQNTEEVGFEPQQQNQPNEHKIGSLQNLELVATHGGLAENATEQAQAGTSNGAKGTEAIQTTSSPAYSVSVFPNPSTGRFVVQINGTMPANVTVELRDLLGKSVYRNLLTGSSNSIDLTGSASGIYFITVCAGKDCWLGKVVKE